MSHAEFAKGLHRMNIHPRHEDMVKILKHYDANEDGEIDFEGFFKTLIPEQGQRRIRRRELAVGRVPRPETGEHRPDVATCCTVNGLEKMLMEKIEQLMDGKGSMIKVFRELDWDRSGTVDPREFRAWLNRPELSPGRRDVREDVEVVRSRGERAPRVPGLRQSRRAEDEVRWSRVT